MSENWDFYFTTIGDHTASIFVDLDLCEEAPLLQFPYLIRLLLPMKMPRPDGLSSSEESTALFNFEDALKTALCNGDPAAVFVGRITSAGEREFFFYASSLDTRALGPGSALDTFPDYEVQIQAKEERSWQTYFDLLLPSEEKRQEIEDRRVCEVLERHGDALDEPREIDHWIYFDTTAARDAFRAEAALMNFHVRCLLDGKQSKGAYGVQLYRSDLPSYAAISSVTVPLFRLAKKLNGEYDGWETQVVTAH